jgi:hypothetical protein
MAWAPCLDGAAVFSRYTIVTFEQDRVAELAALPPPPPEPEGDASQVFRSLHFRIGLGF